MPDLATRLAGHASATALIEGEDRLSYAELMSRILRTAAGLRALGLLEGTRVAVSADATVDGVVAYHGVQAAGLVPAMVNARSPLPELQARFDAVDPVHVLVGSLEAFDVPSGLSASRPAGSSNTDLPALDGDEAPAHEPQLDDPAVVLYTSGVSGLPEPIVLTYRNLAATQDGLIGQDGADLHAGTVGLVGLPLSHVFGMSSVLGSLLRVGAKAVLVPRFEPAVIVETVARHRVTSVSAVPLMWKALAAVGSRGAFETVTRATFAAAAMPPGTPEAVADSLGLEVAGGFGMTETAGTVIHDDAREPTRGSVGRPLGQTELWVVDSTGRAVEAGDFGEVWLRGPSIAQHRLDGGTLDVTDDGWLRTGDIGTLDDAGRLTIVDRQKDVINISGFNVSPREVEAALLSHPSVGATAVVGEVAGDREQVVAHVVPVEGATLDEAMLVEHCRGLLSRYKVPSRVHVQRELPVTESGKAIRRLLSGDARPKAS